MTMGNKKEILCIVVPCYNEEEVLPETNRRLQETLASLAGKGLVAESSFILYVNDGSSDRTWDTIKSLHAADGHARGVSLAANAGHQNALVAGLTVAVDCSDVTITIDADLQDDVNAIGEMVRRYHEGYDIVYGVRSSRKSDTCFKRLTAYGFYSLMRQMGIKSMYNHADYRLMSKRAVRFLLEHHERNLFLRGMIPLIGYKSTCVYYARSRRFAGESKYPFVKMMSFAVNGIVNFSIRPVRLVLASGFIFIAIALCILAWVLYTYAAHNTVRGWASLMLSIWFCSGFILIGMGIIGEYIGKIYIEVKNRPLFNIEETLGIPQAQEAQPASPQRLEGAKDHNQAKPRQ